MSSSRASDVEERVVSALSRGSWLLPLSALGLVGLSEKGGALLPISTEMLVVLAEGAAVTGLALGVGVLAVARRYGAAAGQRRAVAGAALSFAVLLVTQVGAIAGAVTARRAEREMQRAVLSATHDYAGWNGGAGFGSFAVYAVEIPADSDFARMTLRQYDARFRILLFGVEVLPGGVGVALDLGGARALRGDGSASTGLTRAEALDHAVPGATDASIQPTVTRVAPGSRFDGALALFQERESFRYVRAIEVRVDGTARRIPGRFVTLEEKRAVDRARGEAAPR